ncbi:MAG: hypothetical protein EOP45_22105 [Sphingobacteriaceae bacterium]|nr:MAG: hypothetical protein EOP45_22105 [Sphingobacteriaceae bacterium]
MILITANAASSGSRDIKRNIMTNREGLNKLKELSNQLEKVEYEDIMCILKNTIRKIPIPLAKLRAKSAVDRARKNIDEEMFTTIEQLSYIKDKNVIDNYLTEFGRANKPHQPMFYGAVETTDLQYQRITAIAEVSELFQNPNGKNLEGELYTISRWGNKEELILAEVVFASEAIRVNPDIRQAFEKQTEFAKQAGQDDLEFYTDFLVFISEQFAREKQTHHDYKISTAYADLVLKHPDIKGISFPSVQTKYVGINVLFEPQVIDEYFTVEVLATQRLYKNVHKIYLGNHKNCLNPNDCLNNLIWTDLDPKYLTPDEYIQRCLIT